MQAAEAAVPEPASGADEARKAGDNTMKKVLLGTVAVITVIMAAPALAADLPAQTYAAKAPAMFEPPHDWSGSYIGAAVGGGSNRSCWDLANVGGTTVIPSVSEGCHDARGGLAGAQIGYRWQSANWVFGMEAQGDWANLAGSGLSSTAVFTNAVTNATKSNALGLFAGQVGYSWNNFLGYVKGGAAVTRENYSGSLTGFNLTLDQSSETRWGGSIGAGLEIGFAPDWSLGLEYDHLFMGNRNITFPVTALVSSRTDNIHQDVDIGTVRVNYRFGGPVVAKY
jgi:outer membrane immunogenic protein